MKKLKTWQVNSIATLLFVSALLFVLFTIIELYNFEDNKTFVLISSNLLFITSGILYDIAIKQKLQERL